MKNQGFTLMELTLVATFIASVSVGSYQMMRKGQDMRCINNLKQIGEAVADV